MFYVDQISCAEFLKKYTRVLSHEQFNRIEDVSLGITEPITFSDEEIANLDSSLKELNAFNEKLNSTAERNNKGIVFETKGNIDDAIKIYEENIEVGYTAIHSFARLMVIYRKLKKYDDEIRVINKAIEIFTRENEKRLKAAFDKPDNENIKDQLQIGSEKCTDVMGMNGFYAYVPYPIIKWNERLTKAMKLKSNF